MVVANVGMVPTTSPTTVSYTLPSSLVTFVSGVGPGLSFSVSGSLVICFHSSPIAGNSQSGFVLTVAIGNIQSTISSVFTVGTNGDLSTANNSMTDQTPVVAVPSVQFTLNVPSPLSGVQLATGLTVTAFPHPLSGTITLTYVPNVALPSDDPAIQFSTGGRQVAFTIPADSTQALFGGNTEVGFQSGTVAGTITLSVKTVSEGTISPAAVSKSITLPTQVPFVTALSKNIQSGLAILITLFSNTRDLNSISFTFNTIPAVKLSCGAVAGCTASEVVMTFNVSSLFSAWYAADTTYGGLSTVRIPFTIDGSLSGSVAVVLSNSRGSAPSFFTLP